MFLVPLTWMGSILVSVLLFGNNDTVTIAQTPKYKIYEKHGLLFCTGETELARFNNNAAEMIIQNKLNDAIEMFSEGLRRAPLFYPFLFNIGVAYMRIRDYDAARVYFEKAKHIVPENPKIYIMLGELYALTGNENQALSYFRKALQINKKDIHVLVRIGNIYFERNQLELAKRYYDTAVRINPQFPDAIVGYVKIHFKRGEYYKALVRLRSIDISKYEYDYDKSYHYYFAECSFQLKDYKAAYQQYKILTQFKDDVFFITHSYSLIEHKMHLSQRFAELEEGR